MRIEYTPAQKNRLTELGLPTEMIRRQFRQLDEREKIYKEAEKWCALEHKEHLKKLLLNRNKAALCSLTEKMAEVLCQAGFTQIATPAIISAKALEKMSIDHNSHLWEQVYWLDSKSCLRPMLAPNLYEVSRQLMTSQKLPLRIFEVGSCFRRESEGRLHLNEFTMLNLVEWGTPGEERLARLKELIELVMNAVDIGDYQLSEEDSTVYGPGLDVVSADGLELASTSMGPHRLDAGWKIDCTWVGAGFGLERLLMHRGKQKGIRRYARSLSFLDGACLKVR